MSFAGHVFDMIRRQAQNRAMQKRHKERMADRLDGATTTSKKKFNESIVRELSEEKRKQINTNIAGDKRKTWLQTIVVVAIMLFLFYLLAQWVGPELGRRFRDFIG